MWTSSTAGLRLRADAQVDLHLHTTWSDGDWAPEDLLAELAGGQFALAAITDHDRTDTAAAIQQMACARGLPLLTAVEMTTSWQGELVDLLCYGFGPTPNPLSKLAQEVFQRQQENTRAVYARLGDQGFTFPAEALPELLATPSAQQPHDFAALLRQLGYGLREPTAGRILLDAGIDFATNPPAAVVEAAHQSGAVCLLAHPGAGDGFVTFDARLLDRFRAEAPVDGLEVYQPKNSPARTTFYREYARQHGLLVSAGSDSHGPHNPPRPYPVESCRALLERLGISVG